MHRKWEVLVRPDGSTDQRWDYCHEPITEPITEDLEYAGERCRLITAATLEAALALVPSQAALLKPQKEIWGMFVERDYMAEGKPLFTGSYASCQAQMRIRRAHNMREGYGLTLLKQVNGKWEYRSFTY